MSAPPEERVRPRSGAGPARFALPAILALGVALRLHHYLSGRSLWLDEAMLALNLVRRSFAGLVGRLDFNQASPLGFLWLEKGAIIALGPGELSLRLWPLAAGVAALFVFAALSRELLRSAPGRFAVLCFALSGSLVYYAAEVKQYSFDVLLAAALPLLAIRADAAPGGRAWWMLAIAGLLGVWFSHPLIFVLPGLVVYLALRPGEKRDRTRRARLVRLSVLWAIGFAAAFLLTARGTSRSPLMARFWAEGFMPFPPRSAADLAWYGRAAAGWVRNTIDFSETVSPTRTLGLGLGGLLAAAGVVTALRRRRRELWLVALPTVLALGASAASLYPFRGRLLLFLVPSTLILVGWGLEAGTPPGRWRRATSLAAWTGAVAFAGCAAAISFAWARAPAREELRPLLERVAAEASPDDAIYVHSGARHALLFYQLTCAPCRLPTPDLIRGEFLSGREEAIEAELARLPATGRLWALFSHDWWGHGAVERQRIVSALRQRAKALDVYEATGAWAYRFDLGGPSVGAGGERRGPTP